MMKDITIEIPRKIHNKVWEHLLPRRMKYEEVCFLYIRPKPAADRERFVYVDWDLVPPEGFTFRSGYHIELADGVRGRVIKRAHDFGASLVEMHSHINTKPAAFSLSDMIGFVEFVPHVIWRLQGKPYFALVIARGSFDGLTWTNDASTPQRLGGIAVGKSFLTPTKLSPLTWRAYEHRTI